MATPISRPPRANTNVEVTAGFVEVSVMLPRLFAPAPTVYVPVKDTLVLTPETRLMSSRPPVMLPLPSAVKLPAMTTAPPESPPLNRKAYGPVNLASSAGAGAGAGAVRVMVAEADFVASVTEVAVRVTVAGVGGVAGAAYFPVASIVPQLAPVQPVPERLQVTAWLAPLGLTVAVNCCTPPV